MKVLTTKMVDQWKVLQWASTLDYTVHYLEYELILHLHLLRGNRLVFHLVMNSLHEIEGEL